MHLYSSVFDKRGRCGDGSETGYCLSSVNVEIHCVVLINLKSIHIAQQLHAVCFLHTDLYCC